MPLILCILRNGHVKHLFFYFDLIDAVVISVSIFRSSRKLQTDNFDYNLSVMVIALMLMLFFFEHAYLVEIQIGNICVFLMACIFLNRIRNDLRERLYHSHLLVLLYF